MGPEQILRIRIELEDIDYKELKTAGEKIEESLTDSFSEAVRGNEAEMKVLTGLWEGFDWAHPILSAKESLSNMMTWLENRIGKVSIALIGGLIASLAKLWRSLTDIQGDLVKNFAQLQDSIYAGAEGMTAMQAAGMTMGQKVAKAMKDITSVSVDMGDSLTKVKDVYIGLAQIRVPGKDLKDLTELAIQASYALGANQDQMTEMVGTLRVMGKQSVGDIKGIVSTFAAVQNAVGLTQRDMSSLVSTVTDLTMQMQALGASKDSITSLAKATAELTGMFSQLGLGAGRATEIMGKLFDPSQLGQNVFLVRQMGMSMQEYLEMLRGGTIDQTKLTKGLVQASKVIKGMQESGANAIVMNLRAQQLGFKNYQEALRIANLGSKALDEMAKKQKELNWQKEAAEGMAQLRRTFGAFSNRVLAAFSKLLIPLAGRLTDIAAAIEEFFMKNGPAISKFFDNLTDSIVKFLKYLNISNIIKGFKTFINILGVLAKHLKLIIPLALGLTGAFLAFKTLGPIIGIIKGLTGGLKGLVSGAKDIDEVGKVASDALSVLQKGLGSFFRMSGTAIVITAIAGSILLLAKAVAIFTNKTDWAGMAKAGVALLGLLASMTAIGAFMATPVGAAAAAGMAAFVAALGLLSIALLGISKAISNLKPEHLFELANIGANKKLVEGFKNVGIAISAFAKQIGLLTILKAGAISTLGKAIKDFGIGLWLIADIRGLDNIPKNLNSVADSLKAITHNRKIRGDISNLTAGFKELVSGIESLSTIKSGAIAKVGVELSKGLKGLSGTLEALKESSAANLWGLGKDISKTGEAFKDLSIGLWLVADVSDKVPQINKALMGMQEPIKEIFGVLGKAGRRASGNAQALGSLFKAISSGGEVINVGNLAVGINAIAEALTNFGNAATLNFTGQFIHFLRQLRRIRPITVDIKANTPENLEINPKVKSLSGTEEITAKFEMTMGEWGDKIVEAINSLNDDESARDSEAIKYLKRLVINMKR